MCSTCGCDDGTDVRLVRLDEVHPHHHEHPHDEPHSHGLTVTLEQRILAKNEAIAEANRARLTARGTLAVNLMSSPGSGKTTLLEQTIRALNAEVGVAVVEGDQETPLDAQRIRTAGSPVVQINTGAGCHLDAQMIDEALTELDPEPGGLLFIENVGNLVCPALFDLGESARVVIASVTEGADKPLKYPHMFRAADVVLLNKADLLPYVDFDVDAFRAAAHTVRPQVPILTVTASRSDGIEPWLSWLRHALNGRRQSGDLLDTSIPRA